MRRLQFIPFLLLGVILLRSPQTIYAEGEENETSGVIGVTFTAASPVNLGNPTSVNFTTIIVDTNSPNFTIIKDKDVPEVEFNGSLGNLVSGSFTRTASDSTFSSGNFPITKAVSDDPLDDLIAGCKLSSSPPGTVLCPLVPPIIRVEPNLTLPGGNLTFPPNSESIIAAPEPLKIEPSGKLSLNQDSSGRIDLMPTSVPKSEPNKEIPFVSGSLSLNQSPAPSLKEENKDTSPQSNPPTQNKSEEVAPTPNENPKKNYLAKKTEITPSESKVNIEESSNEGSKTLVVSTTTNNVDKTQTESALSEFSTKLSGLQSLVTTLVSFLKQISFFFLS